MFTTGSPTGQRLGYLVNTNYGAVSGHFWNDTGASDEEALNWIIRHATRALTEDWSLVQAVLYRDGKPILTRQPATAE